MSSAGSKAGGENEEGAGDVDSGAANGHVGEEASAASEDSTTKKKKIHRHGLRGKGKEISPDADTNLPPSAVAKANHGLQRTQQQRQAKLEAASGGPHKRAIGLGAGQVSQATSTNNDNKTKKGLHGLHRTTEERRAKLEAANRSQQELEAPDEITMGSTKGAPTNMSAGTTRLRGLQKNRASKLAQQGEGVEVDVDELQHLGLLEESNNNNHRDENNDNNQNDNQNDNQTVPDVAVEDVPVGPPTTTLRRQAHRPPNHLSVPGAYMGESMRRTDNLNFGLLAPVPGTTVNVESDGSGVNPTVADPSEQPPRNSAIRIGDDQLAVANPVTDDPEAPLGDLMHANPVNLEEQEQKHQKLKKQKQTFIFVLILVVLAAATIIGTVAGTSKEQVADLSPTTTTLAPTPYQSLDPSTVPSLAPSGPLDLLLDNLPNQTLANMGTFGTPQWKAWDWLSTHQNISNLAEWRKVQLFAMATFFYSFAGEQWFQPIQDRWLDDTQDECFWYSSLFGSYLLGGGAFYVEYPPHLQTLSCNDQGELLYITLDTLRLSTGGGGFQPKIPPEVALLTSLSRITVTFSSIETSLEDMLSIASSDLSSTASSPYYNQSTSLAHLNFVSNDITGTLPTELGLFQNLGFLGVGDNQIKGPIPSELGLLTSMTGLSLGGNTLTGTLISHLFCMTSLEFFNVGKIWGDHVNQLTGSLPSEVGLWTALTSLDLGYNQFTGQIPSELNKATLLEQLALQHNQFTGPLSGLDLEIMTNLEAIYLGNNSFTGSIPAEIGSLTSLESLDLSELPLLTGPLPSELALLTSLRYFDLTDTPGLSGTLPEQLCFLQNTTACKYFSYAGMTSCFLAFDCTEQLCGCDCPCSHHNDTASSG